MKFKYNFIAFLFIGLLGTFGHFLYEWTGQNTIIGNFFPINESTWEHLKLIFFPTLIFSILEYNFIKREIKNYAPTITISVIAGMLSIIVLFYTYKGVLGYNVDYLNIAIYYIALIVSLIVKNKLIISEKLKSQGATTISLMVLFVIALLFIIFTYNPPAIAIFKKP